MKILFIYPNIGQPYTIHHGIASLSAILKKNGHKTRLLIVNIESYATVKKAILKQAPDILCFSIVSNYWEFSCELAAKIKNDFNISIFAGGMHCSLFPESFTQDSAIDGICIGEGEIALLELIERIDGKKDYQDVNNFWFKGDKGIVKNEIRPLISNLDVLPYPDRDIFYDSNQNKSIRFIFSRGCPYNCTYCSNKAYKELNRGKGEIIRIRSVENVMLEIEKIVECYQPETLVFDDDCFNKNRKWFKEFVKKYKENNFQHFRCNTRPELVSEEDIKLLKEAGCQQINIGIESGDPEIRKNVLNRHMSDEQIINAFRLARKYNIQTYSFNMIGIPGESIENFRKTININRIIQPDKMQLSIFHPYPGTELARICKEQGLISKKNVYNYFYSTYLRLNSFSNFRILINKIFFQFNVYRIKSLGKAIYYLISDLRKYFRFLKSK